MIVALYLGACILANLAIAYFGPLGTIPIAFVLVALDLTTRDLLHDRWAGRYLLPKMGALIAAASALSWALNMDAGPIALASFLAFAASASTDGLVYHALRRRLPFVRINYSNLAGAFVDSVLFPLLAFGELLPLITAGQFVAKVVGGFLWSLVLVRFWSKP